MGRPFQQVDFISAFLSACIPEYGMPVNYAAACDDNGMAAGKGDT
jgi:hypothetical protein